MSEKTTDRRGFVKALAAGVGGLVVGGLAGYFSAPREIGRETVTRTNVVTSTVERTVTQTVGPALPDEIKIGVLLPLSGELGPIGSKMLNGSKLAAKQLNERGGILGRTVTVAAEDTLAQPDKALEAVKKLVEVDGVQVITGPATSVEVLTIADYVKARKVPIISMSATAAKISEIGGDYIFRVVPSDAYQTRALADLIIAKNLKRVATFVVSNDYGIGLEQGLEEKISDRIAIKIRYAPEKGDYREELGRIKNANVDAIFWATWVESGIVALKQAFDLGLTDVQSLGGEGMADTAFFKDKKAAEYLAATNMTGTRPKSPKGTVAYKQFVEAYKQEFGEDPGLFADYTYDSFMVAAAAVAYAGAYQGDKIAKAIPLAAAHYVGPSGHKVMDERGDVIAVTYDIWKVIKTGEENYEITTIGSWDSATGLNITE